MNKMTPFLRCAWERAVFIHYEADPRALQPQVPFPLDLHEGRAWVSLVAFTLRDLRFAGGGPPFTTHRYLNVRTYVKPGAIYFLAEWLSHRLHALLGPRIYGLPFRWGRLEYRHEGPIRGWVSAPGGALRYRAPRSGGSAAPARPGTREHFLLERYTAFTERAGRRRLFRVSHEPWRQASLDLEVEEDRLIASTGPWFRKARLAGAGFSPGLAMVEMGRPIENCAWRDDESRNLRDFRLAGWMNSRG